MVVYLVEHVEFLERSDVLHVAESEEVGKELADGHQELNYDGPWRHEVRVHKDKSESHWWSRPLADHFGEVTVTAWVVEWCETPQ